jgi:tetratricopeptide (TPR) repeat protein
LPIGSVFSIKSIFSIVFHVSIFVYALIKLPKKHILSYGIFFYLFSISIFLGIIRPVMGIVADRYLFSAVFGFSIVLVYILFVIFKIDIKDKDFKFGYAKKPIYIIGVIFILYSFKTIVRNNDWHDRFSLYGADINHLKNSAKANELLANLYFYNSKQIKNDNIKLTKYIKKSIIYYKKSLSIYPYNNYILNDLSYIYLSIHQVDSALFLLNKINDSTNINMLFNKAQAFEIKKDYNNSILYYKKTLQYDTLNDNALSKVTMLLNHVNKKEEAIDINMDIIKTNKNYEMPYINLANIYYVNRDTLQAIKYAEEAIKINPKNTNTINLVYNYYKQKGNTNKTSYYFNLMEQ